MHTVAKKQNLADGVLLLNITAPEIANRARAGSYLVAQISPQEKAHPFFVSGVEDDTVSMIITPRNDPTLAFSKLRKGDSISMVLGPLGRALTLGDFGNVCVVTGPEGLGAMCHVAHALSQYENKVFMITGFHSRKERFWENRIKKVADKSLLVTHKSDEVVNSLVSEFHNLIQKKHMDYVICCGSLPVMSGVSRLAALRTRAYSLVLPPIGDDCTGLTSRCRVLYDGEPKLSCIEGPSFESQKVDWDYLLHYRGLLA